MQINQHEYHTGKSGNRGNEGLLGVRRQMTQITRQSVPNSSSMKTQRIRDSFTSKQYDIWPFEEPPRSSVLKGLTSMQRYGFAGPRMPTEVAPMRLHQQGVHHITPISTRGLFGGKKHDQIKQFARLSAPGNIVSTRAEAHPYLGEQTLRSRQLTMEMVNTQDRFGVLTNSQIVDNIFVTDDHAKSKLKKEVAKM